MLLSKIIWSSIKKVTSENCYSKLDLKGFVQVVLQRKDNDYWRPFVHFEFVDRLQFLFRAVH